MAATKSTPKTSPNINVSMRIDPKTKYLIDLLAREQKRTITGVVEWALDRAALDTEFCSDANKSKSYAEVIDVLWSTDESLRLIRLALMKPSLLNYDEMRVWETIKATQGFWRVCIDQMHSSLKEEHLNVGALQKYWNDLVEHVSKHQNRRSIAPYPLPVEDHAIVKFPTLDDF